MIGDMIFGNPIPPEKGRFLKNIHIFHNSRRGIFIDIDLKGLNTSEVISGFVAQGQV
jgi:hypothetical protein